MHTAMKYYGFLYQNVDKSNETKCHRQWKIYCFKSDRDDGLNASMHAQAYLLYKSHR